MHSRWLKTRRHFYESLRQEIQMITGPLSEDLVEYQREYERIFDKVWDISSMDELISKMLSAKIILAGDFHYFYQSQRTHFRIIRELKKKAEQIEPPISLSLLLEVFDIKDQKKINDFLESKIEFEDLLKKTKWKKRWNQLPHQGYQVLLEWARSQKILVYGINDSTLDKLQDRDLLSAKKIESIKMDHPDAINYVIYGDFHLADSHIPSKISSFDKSRDVVLYLNSDKLYFALSEHAIEDQFNVLKLGHDFCVLSSTPWVKLQSYLVYLQEMDDQMISDIEDDEFEPDYTDYLGKIFEIYAADFDLPDWKKYLDVLAPNDLAFEKLDFLKLSKEEKAKLDYFVTAQKNIVFPRDEMQFLAKPSVNSAYSLVGEFIHSKLSDRESLSWSDPGFMTKRIWIEAVSFFFNLWLNPTVKSLNESDLTARLRAINPESFLHLDVDSGDYAEVVLRFAVDFKMTEVEKLKHNQVRNLVSENIQWSVQLEAAGILGKILGQKLYKNFKSGKINKETLLSYLSVPIESKRFELMYTHVLSSLEKL